MVIFLYYVSLWKDGKVLKGFKFKIFTTKKLPGIQLPSKYHQKFCLLYNIFVKQELYNIFIWKINLECFVVILSHSSQTTGKKFCMGTQNWCEGWFSEADSDTVQNWILFTFISLIVLQIFLQLHYILMYFLYI